VSHSRRGVFPTQSTIPRFRIQIQHSKVPKIDTYVTYLMKYYYNLEDSHNGAVSSFQMTLPNVTAMARIYAMEMRTVFIHRIFNTAISDRHPSTRSNYHAMFNSISTCSCNKRTGQTADTFR
jgi:hypothetical protein